MPHRMTAEDFAAAFGTTVGDLPDACRELIANTDFRYRILEGDERDRIILDVLRKIETDQQKIGAPERTGVWEKGWTENLRAFQDSGHDLKSLVPRFLRPGQIVRLNRNYVAPNNPGFELAFLSVFCQWVFRKYLAQMDVIYEFGCGTGMNLANLAQIFPEKELHGSDFVPSSRELLNKIGEVYGWNLTGHFFNMIEPDEGFKLKKNGAVLTFGAIEQLAGRFENFLQFLLARSPALCISLEPTIELYDENHLLDHLAIRFHRKRGYTENYLTRLRELERGRNRNLKSEEVVFWQLVYGGLFMLDMEAPGQHLGQ